jgi:hypothetical protein
MFGASPPEYDIGTKDEIKVFVKSVNNVSSFEVATVNLKTLNIQSFQKDIAMVTAFKLQTGIVGIKTVHNNCQYLYFPERKLYDTNLITYKSIDDYPIPIQYTSFNHKLKNYLCRTSGGLPSNC